MLRLLRLVEQFSEIEQRLVDEWAELRFQLTLDDELQAERAAALLAPANPGRLAAVLHFAVDRRGPGIGPEALRRLLKRLDDEGITGTLALQGVQKAPPADLPRKEKLRAQWELRLAAVPADWSDIYAQVRLDSTDYLERGALLLAPVNPSRYGGPAALRFRSAQHFGYGVSPDMAGRCFERCDDEGITGDVEILYVLSDTHPEATQGPVWLLGGRTV
jgi:GNAT superfamily N-acetyltransferase